MFLLTPDRDGCQKALEKLHRALGARVRGPMELLPLAGSWLGWFPSRPADNLHLFDDGCVVGKMEFPEESHPRPIRHAGRMRLDLHPLAAAVVMESSSEGAQVRPHGVTNVFHDRDSASDMQMLLASLKGYRPGPEGVALLATVGYLPGDLTLFREIEKVPLFHRLGVGQGRVERVASFESSVPDDDAMVERLISLVPTRTPSVLGLSAGYDSRFVLGILKRAEADVRLVRLSDEEDRLTEALAKQVALPLEVVTQPAADPGPYEYTLMTDAQIYHRGGHYGRLRSAVPPGALYFTGLFADSIVKNAFRAAWKVPHASRELHGLLVQHALLSRMRDEESGLRAMRRRKDLRRFLSERLSPPDPGSGLSKAKEVAAWFYFVHRGVRWTPAHVADFAFDVEPVFLLSDLRALALGIRSPAWANFSNDRVRALNRLLLPEVSVGYSNGQSATLPRQPLRSLRKIQYEYLDRGWAYLAGRAREKRAAPVAGNPGLTERESPSLLDYFDGQLKDVLESPEYSRSVKRAAVTVNSALLYLEAAA